MAFFIWIPFALVALVYSIFRSFMFLAYPRAETNPRANLQSLERRLTLWFRVWVFAAVVETIASGGLPIIWLIQGSSKIYFDYGIPSLHGLVNSLLFSIALCSFALFLATGKRNHLGIPVFALLWSILILNRNMMLVCLLEAAIVFVCLRGVRILTLFKLGVGLLLFILGFGYLGDFRSGSAQTFRLLAEPASWYPEWLPSGILWAYIYITTPINNLVNTMHSGHPVYSLLFPNTVANLFPSVIRDLVYGGRASDALSGQIVSEIFNASSAYIGPLQDFGLLGVVLYSIIVAFACQYFWFRTGLKNILVFAVLTQCLILSLFYNHFFYLPVITQLLWFSIFFARDIQMRKIVMSQTHAI